MFTLRRLYVSCLLLPCLFSNALAQGDQPGSVGSVDTKVQTTTTVTASATAERVRFTAPGNVTRMQLQIISETGQIVFDVSSKGNVLDWSLQDSGGQLLQGAYLMVVTVKSLSGRLSERIGSVSIVEKRVELKVVEPAGLNAAQQQAVGPLEEKASLTILAENEVEAITAITHQGTDGQLTRTRGALSFRVGDFFSGNDKEQMRLTEEGNLGIGTSKPKAKLDVAGMIRAREGFMFSDGSSLSVADSGALVRTSGAGKVLPGPGPLAAGTGTQDRLAKWAETGGAGTLTNSLFSESGPTVTHHGNFFKLTGTPSSSVESNILHVDTNNKTMGQVAGPGSFFGGANGPYFILRGNQYSAIAGQRGLAIFSGGNVTSPLGREGSVQFNTLDQIRMLITPAGNVGIGLGLNGIPSERLDVLGNGRFNGNLTVTGTLNATLPVGSTNYIQNNPGSQQPGSFNISGGGTLGGLTVDTNTLFVNAADDRVGIGTTTPGAKLDVVGHINTSTQYNIGGQRVLSASSESRNIFAGLGAGQANTTGTDNSFFGGDAGLNNSTGEMNSFFGKQAGQVNTEGYQNSFFGMWAGLSNQTGIQNSFFGLNSGANNISGGLNTFVGYSSGTSNIAESYNTFIGGFSDGAADLTNATAIGYRAQVTQSDSLVLGSINGTNGALASTKVGIGTPAPTERLHVVGNGLITGNLTVTGTLNAALPAGSTNYIQNTTTQQASSDFNISGDGTASGTLSANVVNAVSHYEIAGNTILSVAGAKSTLAGVDSGPNNAGDSNSFFGKSAGFTNTLGSFNSFFGESAGYSNSAGGGNSFFGESAGRYSEGLANSFFGANTGGSNTGESNNTLIGTSSDVAAGVINATALGYRSKVTQSNSLVLGSINTVNGAFADTKVGIGTTAPTERLHVVGNGLVTGNLTLSGNLQMPGTASQFFGNTTRQMLNLWSSVYGVGVQNNTLYTRSDGGFAWFKQGTHDDDPNDAGTGGTVLMTLDASGNLNVTGNLSKGGGSFKIDHPLDPANKTLSHSFVESPDMMNVYNGNIMTDARGLAVVTLPNYFQTLNRDFRYQLTVIGQFAQAIVLKKIEGNRFQIKTNKPRVEVSWQVTGVRQDAYANAHRIPTEELKPQRERGTYLHPDAFAPKRTAMRAHK